MQSSRWHHPRPLQLLFDRCIRISIGLLVIAVIAGCGGSGSKDDKKADDNPAPFGNFSIRGVASLGVIRSGRIGVEDRSGSIGSGETDQDGRFESIRLREDFEGAVRVTVSADRGDGATWVCDFIDGCRDGEGGFVPFGAVLDFEASLEAVLPSVEEDQTIQVSLLSHMASRYAAQLGPLTSGNVIQANTEVHRFITAVLGEIHSTSEIRIPEHFTSVLMTDINNPEPYEGGDHPVAAALSLINSSLMALMPEEMPLDEFVNEISKVLHERGSIPDGGLPGYLLSRDRLMAALIRQVSVIRQQNSSTANALHDLLSPVTLYDMEMELVGNLLAMRGIAPSNPSSASQPFWVSDGDVPQTIERFIELRRSDGEALAAEDVRVELESPWVSGEILSVDGVAHLLLSVETLALDTLEAGFYAEFANVFSVDGSLRLLHLPIYVQSNIVGLRVSAGASEIQSLERESVQLFASSNRPNVLESLHWEQVGGPEASLSSDEGSEITASLPSLSGQHELIFQVAARDNLDNVDHDSVTIVVTGYPELDGLNLVDDTLEQCIVEIGATQGLEDTGEVEVIDCVGVGNLAGISSFPALREVRLPGNQLDSLNTILALDSLEYVDVTGNPNFACAQIEALEQSLEPEGTVLADDLCFASDTIDLLAPGHETVLDPARQQVYVSLPQRNEIAVVSLVQRRVTDRMVVPGSPYGIALSIDGTRLFAALRGNNEVAEIDLDLRSVRLIDLSTHSGHSSTWDVIEAATDRLIVTTAPGSSGFAYAVEVRLDLNDATSRIAGGRIIRAAPRLAVDRDAGYLYKLDLDATGVPIVLEDDHGAVSGTYNLALNGSGDRIALASGQVLRTGSFDEEGRIPSGASAPNEAGNRIVKTNGLTRVEFYDFDTLALQESRDTSCSLGSAATQLHAFDGDARLVLLYGQEICLEGQVSRSESADPYPELRFSDIAFETCVRGSAELAGVSLPSEIVSLDCSMSTRRILSIDGIETLTNLEFLDLSHSSVIDLAALSNLSALATINAVDLGLADVDALTGHPSLNSADLSGNPGVECAAFDQLVDDGINLTVDLCSQRLELELPAVGWDIALDLVNNRAFISLPTSQSIVEVDTQDLTIVSTIETTEPPRGIDLSSDGATLYAALYGIGSVAYIATETRSQTVVNINERLRDNRTWDIVEYAPDKLLVSASPSSSGFAHIVHLQRDNGNSSERVASGRIIRAGPVFAANSDGSSVYVGEGFSPNSIYKLDTTQVEIPIVAEDDHGSVNGSSYLVVTKDDSSVVTASGQIVDAETITPSGVLPSGRSLPLSDGESIIIDDQETDTLGIYDLSTRTKVGKLPIGCDMSVVSRLAETATGGVIAMGSDKLCTSSVVEY